MDLNGRKVAILVADGFEQVEMTVPREALHKAGAGTMLISPSGGYVRGWNDKDWGDTFQADLPLDEADPRAFDALLLPGGVLSPDKLRRDPRVIEFVRSFFDAGKPVGAICHGLWTLIEVGIVRGRTLTSYESIQTDMKNAGANWVDQEVVVDNGLVTSRKPADLPAFSCRFIEEIHEGVRPPAKGSKPDGDASIDRSQYVSAGASL